MTGKILVVYASRTGTTQGVAEAIGKTLAEGGVKVDVLPVNEVSDLTAYRAVIAGSAVQANRWLPEAFQFPGVWKTGDHRDWIAIHAWAKKLQKLVE